MKLLGALRSGTTTRNLGTSARLTPTIPYIDPGDPAVIHPFLADLGKERSRRSQDSSSSNIDLGALALHLAIRCASSTFQSFPIILANGRSWRMVNETQAKPYNCSYLTALYLPTQFTHLSREQPRCTSLRRWAEVKLSPCYWTSRK